MVVLLQLAGAGNVAAAADRTRPTTPTNLRATAINTTSVTLAWNPSTDNSGSFTYIVRELNSGQTRSVTQTQTTLTWTGLQPNTTYRFVVFARDAAGNQSPNSNTLTVKTKANPPVTTPPNLRVTGSTVSTISFAWDAVSGATGYEVGTPGSFWGNPVGLQTTHTVVNLMPGTTYQYVVRAVGPSGTSPWSAPVTGSTLADTVTPTVPVFTVAVALSPGVVQLNWTESTDNTAYVGYNIYVNGQPARSMLPHNVVPRQVTIQNLRGGTTYEFTVRAYDGTGNFSAASEPAMLTTPLGTDVTPPATPANLQIIPSWGNGISTVGLGWGWAADDTGTMAYEIYMDGTLVGETLLDVHYGGVATSFIARNIPPGTTHSFTVRARDEAGNVSAESVPINVTMASSTDITPPTAATNFMASSWPGCAFLDIWVGNSVDDDPSGQLEYEIYEDGVFLGVYRWEAFEASFGRHTYYIRAVDRAGNRSAPSNVVVIDNGLDC